MAVVTVEMLTGITNPFNGQPPTAEAACSLLSTHCRAADWEQPWFGGKLLAMVGGCFGSSERRMSAAACHACIPEVVAQVDAQLTPPHPLQGGDRRCRFCQGGCGRPVPAGAGGDAAGGAAG